MDTASDVPESDSLNRFSVLRRRRYSESDLSGKTLLPIHQLLYEFPLISETWNSQAINSAAATALHPATVQNPELYPTLAWSAMNTGNRPPTLPYSYNNPDLRLHTSQNATEARETTVGGQQLGDKPYIGMQRSRLGNVSMYPSPPILASSARPEYSTRSSGSTSHFHIAPGSTSGPSSYGRPYNPQNVPIGFERQVDWQYVPPSASNIPSRTLSPDPYGGLSRDRPYQDTLISPGRNRPTQNPSALASFESLKLADNDDPYITRPNPHHSSSFPQFQRRATVSTAPFVSSRSHTLPVGMTAPQYGESAPKSPTIRKPTVKPSNPIHQPFHPKPPDKPSDFSMWVGNLPKLAPHDELWVFFTQAAAALPHSPSNSSRGLLSAGTVDHGVLSIFLISKTNCAFVDYATEEHRDHATAFFDGKPLRLGDPRCPKLICRARKKEDELTAGVGAQRRCGFHRRWVEEQQHNLGSTLPGSHRLPSTRVPDTRSNPNIDRLAYSSTERQNTDTRSDESTTSSFLAMHFPTRYFILKALVQSDLDASVKTGTWRTQHHNEDVLEQAFRTSRDVFLIFSVNKSGEFFGYARMNGSIPREILSDEEPHNKLGRPFQIQWRCTKPVSFFRTRHLRNPWNRGREIKISRDGMELEVNLGQVFLREYLELAEKVDTKKGQH